MPNPRLFVGDLGGGDYRVRISKPGADASDPDLSESDLHFDSSWEFLGNIHAMGTIRNDVGPSPYPPFGTKTIPFPELPYVPMFYICVSAASAASGEGTLWNELVLSGGGDGAAVGFTYTITQSEIYISRPGTFGNVFFYYIVFKIPMLDVEAPEDDPPIGRVLIGNRSGDAGIFLSRPGFDVASCEPEQLTLDSSSPRHNILTSLRWVSLNSVAEGGHARNLAQLQLAIPGYFPGVIPLLVNDVSKQAIIPQQLQNSSDGWAETTWNQYIYPTDSHSVLHLEVRMDNLDTDRKMQGNVVLFDMPIVFA